MTPRIAQLLRTNIALALLCAIAIGVLVILVRQPGRSGQAPVAAKQAVASVTQTGTPGALAPDAARSPIAQASFADMPAPASFRSFVFGGQSTLSATGTCADSYEAVMIFPLSVDYRIDPAAATYNVAEACASGRAFSKDIDLTSLGLQAGSAYYLIRASEGASGTWYNPY